MLNAQCVPTNHFLSYYYLFTDICLYLKSKFWFYMVTGYTIKEIEDALKGQKTWNSWRDNIKNKYTNETKDNLDVAFAFWNTK